MDGWMDRKKWMDGYKQQMDGWIEKIDGWLGYILIKKEWLDEGKHRRMVGWIEIIWQI